MVSAGSIRVFVSPMFDVEPMLRWRNAKRRRGLAYPSNARISRRRLGDLRENLPVLLLLGEIAFFVYRTIEAQVGIAMSMFSNAQ